MQQQIMGALVRQATGLSPRLRAADGISFSSGGAHGHHRVVLATAMSKDKFFEIEMVVRDDEVDEYGVVNNPIYASYLHSGRDVMLEQLGISVDYWTSTGNAMALSELNLKYFAPLRSGDVFVVKVKPVLIKGVRIIVEHMIETLQDRKLVLEGRAVAVCLNKDFRPTRVFPELSASLIEVFSCKVA
ncbi:acyl-acyl carrier protein thioesterase ATL3, chloroplastic-like [Panicum virgatum]|uniref:acyl-acyl carrier protein thioesterase ATL3, chloroplastic-like n=1 Tax=Panicum virgatum TaxID=38727 RepID=UPI0019D63D89|nr:acyl-acyl carrier protein thioesterase ATL3, chloroplastic-like [Panicum virgatum]